MGLYFNNGSKMQTDLVIFCSLLTGYKCSLRKDTENKLNPYIDDWLTKVELSDWVYVPNIVLYDFVTSDISRHIIEMNLGD